MGNHKNKKPISILALVLVNLRFTNNYRGAHIIFPVLIMVPVGRMGQKGPYNCSGGPMTHTIVPGDPWGPLGPWGLFGLSDPWDPSRPAAGGRQRAEERNTGTHSGTTIWILTIILGCVWCLGFLINFSLPANAQDNVPKSLKRNRITLVWQICCFRCAFSKTCSPRRAGQRTSQNELLVSMEHNIGVLDA